MKFEQATKRLEEILAKMQEGTLPLEDALNYYQEANQLVTFCTKTLTEAEKRVEVLIKAREGGLELNPDGTPQMRPFE
jgi:exodeoxyribonuclease VII small subunit